MNLAGIFLMVFIFSIVYYIVSMPVAQKGGEETELTLKQSESIYARQFNELHDVNNVLKRPIKPVDETTDHLVGFESSVPSESRPAELQSHAPARCRARHRGRRPTPARHDAVDRRKRAG